MIKTPIGIINILVNGEKSNYELRELTKVGKNFLVDERFEVIVDIPQNANKDTMIECKITDSYVNNIKRIVESGEQLVLISLYSDNLKLSIGTEDKTPNIFYTYTNYGLSITVPKDTNMQRIVFRIAWINMHNKAMEDIYTWFAADPTLN